MRNGLTTQTVPESTVDFTGPRPRYITGRPTRSPYRQLDGSLRNNLRHRASLLDDIAALAAEGHEQAVIALAHELDAQKARGYALRPVEERAA